MEYSDGGVAVSVQPEEMVVYELRDAEWNDTKWYKATNLAASRVNTTVGRLECIRVPTNWRKVAGVREY